MVFTGIRGRDGGTVSPLEIPEGLAQEVVNIDLDGTGLGRKRRGHAQVTTTNNFPAGTQTSLLLHIPGADASAAEIWGLASNVSTIARMPVSTGTWSSALTVKDAITSSVANAQGVSFNGKFYLAYDSAADRLHVWDGSTVRRVGLAAPAAPTVANTGAGAYAATQRWYQQSYRIKSGSTVIAESERSASVAFTPSGAGTAARVTKAASTSESETHWVLWGSETSTSGPFYEIAETAVGTTTYDDSAAPSTYDNGTAAQTAGTFTVPTSARYILNDGGNRLLLAGAYETGGYTSRVWYTPVLGSLARGDDERIPTNNYLDLEENDGGAITGLAGPLNGQPIVFKERQIWRLVPTGDTTAPYQPRVISKAIGCINARSIAMGEDEAGQPALYFASQTGVYRLGANGLQDLSHNIADLWQNRDTTTAFGGWYGLRRQYWLCLRNAASTTVRMRFHAQLGRPDGAGRVIGGWVTDEATTFVTAGIGMAMIPHSPGLTAGAGAGGLTIPDVSIPRPHILTSAAFINRADDTALDGSSGVYHAYVQVPPQTPAGIGVKVRTGPPVLLGKSFAGEPNITVWQLRNGEAASAARKATGALTLAISRLRVCEQGGGTDDSEMVGFRVGDDTDLTSVTSAVWTIDALIVSWEPAEDLAKL